jgi:molecular chaperone GrpE
MDISKMNGKKEIPITFADGGDSEPEGLKPDLVEEADDRVADTAADLPQEAEDVGSPDLEPDKTEATSADDVGGDSPLPGNEESGESSESADREVKGQTETVADSRAQEDLGLILAQGQALEEAQAQLETQGHALEGAQTQIERLLAERSNLYDQLLRRQAEFENFRRRSDREKVDSYHRLRAEILLEMLPVMDSFERALVTLQGSRRDADAMYTGLELIHRLLKDALTKIGLQPLETLGAAFDPNVHEAITVEPTDEHEENTIIEEFERGYKLGDRLLRPAKVKVAGPLPR